MLSHHRHGLSTRQFRQNLWADSDGAHCCYFTLYKTGGHILFTVQLCQAASGMRTIAITCLLAWRTDIACVFLLQPWLWVGLLYKGAMSVSHGNSPLLWLAGSASFSCLAIKFICFEPFQHKKWLSLYSSAICVHFQHPMFVGISVLLWLVAVVQQFYDTDVNKEYSIRGNSAVLKCQVPSFVADFVNVVSWHTDQGDNFYPSASDYGNS